MNVVIIGLGEVGSHLAQVISREGHAVTAIDPDVAQVKHSQANLDILVLRGDGASPQVLQSAGADRADLLLCVSSNDRVNMLAARFGRGLGSRRVVLRVKDEQPLEDLEPFLRKELGYDLLLCTDELASRAVTRLVALRGASEMEDFADGRVQMRKLGLSAAPAEKLLGQPLRELALPAGVLVAAISRDGKARVPSPDDRLAAEDAIYVLGEPKAVSKFQDVVCGEGGRPASIAMVGGVGAGLAIARRLEARASNLRFLVEDRDEAQEISAKLRHALVLNTHAVDYQVFGEERIGDVDVFVGACAEDEKNLMACQLARSLGARRTIAVVHRPDYVELYQRLGIDAAVSPRRLCAARIMGFVRAGGRASLASIEEGSAEILELEAEPGAKVLGKPLSQVRFPGNAKVAAICRGDDVTIPNAASVIEAHDRVIVFSAVESVRQVVEMITGRRSEV